MSDRENFIKGIQECNLNGGLIGNCPYKGIIAMLKEQKPVKPISYYHGLDRPFTYRCGHCFHSLKDGDHFCSGCGKEIDWE